MSCTVPTTTKSGPCTQCKHPFFYLFELVKEALNHPNNRTSFAEALDRILDKGIITTNCDICCPDCEGVYSLASVETQLKLLEALGLTASAAVPALPPIGAVEKTFGGSIPDNGEPCCSNVHASVETWLKYADAMGLTQSAAVPALPFSQNLGTTTFSEASEEVMTCCNGFTGCVDDLLCWAMAGTSRGTEVIDRILDKGISEYGGIYNDCDPVSKSQICYLVQLFVEYNVDGGSRAEIIDRMLDKGLTISCSEHGEIVLASVETWLKYAEAVGLTASAAVPALAQTTTTTTVI